MQDQIIHKVSHSRVKMLNLADWQPGGERTLPSAPSYKRDIAPKPANRRQTSRSIGYTLSPARERVKIGSPEVRAKLAKDIRIMRLLDRTASKIGSLICQRIATPKRANDVPHLATGNEKTGKGKRVALSKVTPNPLAGMVKTQPRANGHFPSRYVSRKDISLSFHDRQEVISVVRTVLTIALEPDGVFQCCGKVYELPHWNGKRIAKDSPLWSVFYRATRDTLGMFKVMSKEMSFDYLGECGIELEIELASDELEESIAQQATEANIARKVAHARRCIEATHAHDKSRKAHKHHTAYRGMCAFVDILEAYALGKANGHGMASPEATRRFITRFNTYVARGEELLRMEPTSLASELTEAISQRRIE